MEQPELTTRHRLCSNISFITDLIEFMQIVPGVLGERTYLYGRYMTVEMKVYHRHVEGEYYTSIEVVDVNVKERGKGFYSEFLKLLEEHAPRNRCLFINNVIHPEQEELYIRRGYKYYGKLKPSNMYKLV